MAFLSEVEIKHMNRSMILGIVLGAGVATAGGAIAGYQLFKEPTHADVLQAVAITKKVKVPHEECHDCLLYTSPSPRDRQKSRMPSSA